MSPLRTWTTTGLLTIWAASALAQPAQHGPLLAPLAAAAWRTVGLPNNKAPLTAMDIATLDGMPALRLRADASYASLVHDLNGWLAGREATLRWRWRLDQPVAGADLRRKDADDAALKVCLMFDMPLDRVPFVERSLLRLARAVSGEPLPAATVCYVWDVTLAQGTVLPNAYSARVRYLVLDGAASPPGQWRSHQRNLQADFARLFGGESPTLPPVQAVAVGADADNTGARSLAWIADIQLAP
ncbi:MAG: DUF3047 domain-containing protein [Ramlibacter sp.]